jgi:hypothetical protein
VYRVDPTGIITTVFGGTVCATETDTKGDGCPTTAATISPQGMVFDSADNLYVADELNGLIREANVTSSVVNFAGTYGLTIPPQVVNVYNPSNQTLKLSSITAQTPFSQVATGGSTDCDSSTSLAPGTSCQIGISITAATGGPFTGTLQVGSNGTNATSGQNTVNLSAAIATAGSGTTLTASPAVPAQVGPGQPVTFTATVHSQTGVSTIPTGTVTLNNGATVLASNVQLNSSGVATYTSSTFYGRIVCGNGCLLRRHRLQHQHLEYRICEGCFNCGPHRCLNGNASQRDRRAVRYAYGHGDATQRRRIANGDDCLRGWRDSHQHGHSA